MTGSFASTNEAIRQLNAVDPSALPQALAPDADELGKLVPQVVADARRGFESVGGDGDAFQGFMELVQEIVSKLDLEALLRRPGHLEVLTGALGEEDADPRTLVALVQKFARDDVPLGDLEALVDRLPALRQRVVQPLAEPSPDLVLRASQMNATVGTLGDRLLKVAMDGSAIADQRRAAALGIDDPARLDIECAAEDAVEDLRQESTLLADVLRTRQCLVGFYAEFFEAGVETPGHRDQRSARVRGAAIDIPNYCERVLTHARACETSWGRLQQLLLQLPPARGSEGDLGVDVRVVLNIFEGQVGEVQEDLRMVESIKSDSSRVKQAMLKGAAPLRVALATLKKVSSEIRLFLELEPPS